MDKVRKLMNLIDKQESLHGFQVSGLYWVAATFTRLDEPHPRI